MFSSRTEGAARDWRTWKGMQWYIVVLWIHDGLGMARAQFMEVCISNLEELSGAIHCSKAELGAESSEEIPQAQTENGIQGINPITSIKPPILGRPPFFKCPFVQPQQTTSRTSSQPDQPLRFIFSRWNTLADRETLQRSHGISAGETLRRLYATPRLMVPILVLRRSMATCHGET